MQPPGAVQGLGPKQPLPRLAAESPGVHPHRTADGARDADQELEPGKPGPLCHLRHALIQGARPGDHDRRPSTSTRASGPPKRTTTPSNPPSRTSRFEATPIGRSGTSGGNAARKAARSAASAGWNTTLGRAADAEPGDGRQRHVAPQAAADLGQMLGRQPLMARA